MKRTAGNRPGLLKQRKRWPFNPVQRVRESAKRYNRGRARIEARRNTRGNG